MSISCFKWKSRCAHETHLQSTENQYRESHPARSPREIPLILREACIVLKEMKICKNSLGNFIMGKLTNNFKKLFPLEINGTTAISQLHV